MVVDGFIRMLRRTFIPAVLISAVGATGVYFVSARLPVEYTAESVILVAPTNTTVSVANGGLVPAPPLNVRAYREAALSDAVTAFVMDDLGHPHDEPELLEEFRTRVSIEIDEKSTSSLIRVVFTDSSPSAAKAGADSWASAILNWDEARAQANLSIIIEAIEAQIRSIDDQIINLSALPDVSRQRLDGQLALRASRQELLISANAALSHHIAILEIIRSATVPIEPSFPKPLLFASLAFVVLLVIVYGIALMFSSDKSR